VLTRQNKTQGNLTTKFCGTFSPQGNTVNQHFTCVQMTYLLLLYICTVLHISLMTIMQPAS